MTRTHCRLSCNGEVVCITKKADPEKEVSFLGISGTGLFLAGASHVMSAFARSLEHNQVPPASFRVALPAFS